MNQLAMPASVPAPIRDATTDVHNSHPSLPRWLIRPILAFARVINPWLLHVAGRRGVPFAVVRHSGRRSGRQYVNPVVALPTSDGFVISLPYGSGTNWCRNVLASNAAFIRWQGVDYRVVQPEVLDRAAAQPFLGTAIRQVLRLVRLRQFLRVHTAERTVD